MAYLSPVTFFLCSLSLPSVYSVSQSLQEQFFAGGWQNKNNRHVRCDALHLTATLTLTRQETRIEMESKPRSSLALMVLPSRVTKCLRENKRVQRAPGTPHLMANPQNETARAANLLGEPL